MGLMVEVMPWGVSGNIMECWLKDATKTRPPNWEDIIYYIVSMFFF